MLDIGWTELLIIGVVALIVVGPKDLPGLFRNLGKMMARVRGMGRDFQRAMDNAADESGVRDVARDFRDAASGKDMGLDELKDVAKGPKHWKARAKAGLKGAAPTDEEAAEQSGTDAAAADDPAGDVAAAPAAPKPGRGPATQALARKRATEAAARKAPPAAEDDPPPDHPAPASGAARRGAARPATGSGAAHRTGSPGPAQSGKRTGAAAKPKAPTATARKPAVARKSAPRKPASGVRGDPGRNDT